MFFYKLKSYFKFLPVFLIGSGTAFLVDVIIYTLIRQSLGTNLSAIISLFFGSITLFTILRILQISRIKKKRVGLSIQLLIACGSFIINIIIRKNKIERLF